MCHIPRTRAWPCPPARAQSTPGPCPDTYRREWVDGSSRVNRAMRSAAAHQPTSHNGTNHPLGAARGLEREQVPLPKQLDGCAGHRSPVLHLHSGLARDRRLFVRAARVGRVPLRLALCVEYGSNKGIELFRWMDEGLWRSSPCLPAPTPDPSATPPSARAGGQGPSSSKWPSARHGGRPGCGRCQSGPAWQGLLLIRLYG